MTERTTFASVRDHVVSVLKRPYTLRELYTCLLEPKSLMLLFCFMLFASLADNNVYAQYLSFPEKILFGTLAFLSGSIVFPFLFITLREYIDGPVKPFLIAGGLTAACLVPVCYLFFWTTIQKIEFSYNQVFFDYIRMLTYVLAVTLFEVIYLFPSRIHKSCDPIISIGHYKMRATNLAYAQSEDHYIRIFTTDGCSFFVREKISALEETLSGFGIVISRGFWIAFHHVHQIDYSSARPLVTLSDGKIVPIAHRRKAEVTEAFEAWAARQIEGE